MIKRLIPNCIWKAAALVLLASCTAEHPADENASLLPEGMYPITFTATVTDGSPSSRLTETADGKLQWEANDDVALSDGTIVKRYVATEDENGKIVFTSDDPFYWKSSTQAMNIEAWYPYSAIKPTAQNGVLSLAAPAQEAKFGQPLNLTFTPQVAKVIVNIKKQGALNKADMIEEVKINGITPKTITANNGFLASYEAVLAPVSINPNAPFVSIQVKDYGKRTYKMQAQTTLTAGQAYTYNIGVKDLPYITSNSNQTITVTDGEEITIKGNGETTGPITIQLNGNATINLDQVNIKGTDFPITIQGNGTATIQLKGNNTLDGNGGGLCIDGENTHVVITGNGNLTAKGSGGAAIGSKTNKNCGDITIQNTQVEVHTTEKGFGCGAGIGTGANFNGQATCDDITIINSTIIGSTDGKGAGAPGAVIGTGEYGAGNQCGTITIQLQQGQDIDAFLGKLIMINSGNAYKVGRGKDGGEPACTVIWKNSSGNKIGEGERKD